MIDTQKEKEEVTSGYVNVKTSDGVVPVNSIPIRINRATRRSFEKIRRKKNRWQARNIPTKAAA